MLEPVMEFEYSNFEFPISSMKTLVRIDLDEANWKTNFLYKNSNLLCKVWDYFTDRQDIDQLVIKSSTGRSNSKLYPHYFNNERF